jgi:ParB-like chromosome segregation protein Spo0J
MRCRHGATVAPTVSSKRWQPSVASIGRHGFWRGIRARKVDDAYQLAMGHHRIEAARRAKLKEVDIDVQSMSDDEMIRLMTTENAIQAGSKAAARSVGEAITTGR